MANNIKDPKDFGTSEISRRFTVIIPRYTGRGAKVMDETEIDRLLIRGEINQNQHGTLEGLLRRLHKAQFVGVRSPTYDSPMNADPTRHGDKKAATIMAVLNLFEAMDKKMGADRRRALVNLVLLDHEWPFEKPKDSEDKTTDLQDAIKHLDDAIAGR